MIRFFRSMLIFARFQEWVEPVKWDVEDAQALGRYLQSRSGKKLVAALTNMALREQAKALTKTEVLAFEAGYCNGQKGVLAAIEGLADLNQFTAAGESDTDPLVN